MEATREIKRVCWENAGIVREGVLLEEAREELEDVEAENMCLSARAVVESALMRTESRGAHYRMDYPESDDARWRVNIFVKKDEKDFLAQARPVGRHAW